MFRRDGPDEEVHGENDRHSPCVGLETSEQARAIKGERSGDGGVDSVECEEDAVLASRSASGFVILRLERAKKDLRDKEQ